MATITLTVSQEKLEKMYLHYSKHIVKIPNHTLFQAKTANCTITAYLSKKVVFQGKSPEVEAKQWGSSAQSTPKTTISHSQLPEQIATMSAVGCDEVGTGDYFGPLVVCCAYVPQDQIKKLQDMGVKDSKALKDSEILHLAKQIEPYIRHQVLILPNQKYNEMIDRGMNANSIKAFLHNQALLKLTASLNPYPEYLIMDEFVNERKYFEYLTQLPKQSPIIKDHLYFIQKGESVHIAVAAASILARASFVKYMSIMSKKLNFELPKGAGDPVDVAGRRLIQQLNTQQFKDLTKWHFANTKKIIK